MSALSDLVAGLHAQAQTMNAELHAQSSLLDATLTSSEAQQASVHRNNDRARNLIGR